jgi:hypothetical protein
MLRAGGRWNAVRTAQNAAIRSRLSGTAMATGPAAALPINLVGEPNQNQNTTGLAPAVPNANNGIMDSPNAERGARIDELRARLRREHRAELRDSASADYDSCNNAFKNFVEVLRQDEFVPVVGTIYTVRNVELFFQIVVANKTSILPKSARKFLYAIEYHAH